VRAVPGTGTQAVGPGHAWAVLSRVVPGLAQRAWPVWKTLVWSILLASIFSLLWVRIGPFLAKSDGPATKEAVTQFCRRRIMPDFFLEFFPVDRNTDPRHFFTSLSFFNRRLSMPAAGGSSTFLSES
jgi:hypothetical protein